jgi:hypothetical protein
MMTTLSAMAGADAICAADARPARRVVTAWPRLRRRDQAGKVRACRAGDCLDQLDASHDRQVRALASLVAGARELEVNAHEVRAVEWGTDEVGAALAFWQRAVERHFADEELSLFPRLAARRPDLAAEIERVVAEHATHRALAPRRGRRLRPLGADPGGR